LREKDEVSRQPEMAKKHSLYIIVTGLRRNFEKGEEVRNFKGKVTFAEKEQVN
jgi:hypothetical protein